MGRGGKIVDLSKFPVHELRMEIVETVDGGYAVNWHITGKTRRYRKRKASKEGGTLEEWIDHHLMPIFSGRRSESDSQ